MKPSRIPAGALALAACVLFPGASRADNAPYSIQANPAGQVAEGSPVRFKPVRAPNTFALSPVCTLEVWPESGGHGAVWLGAADQGCSREDAVNLPPGRYVVKLNVRWRVKKNDPEKSGIATLPYAVVSSVNKLQMTKCVFSPAQPMVGRQATLSWEVRSGAPGALGPFRVSVLAGHEKVDDFTVSAIGAGATVPRSVPWTPSKAGAVKLECVADPENAVHEDPTQRKDNTLFGEVVVQAAAVLKPVVVLGKLTLGTLDWIQEYTVCNVDPDAFYANDLSGCARPCGGGYNGVPSRDFTRDRIAQDGSTMTPPCPAGLVSRIGFKPGGATGVRNQYEDRTYTLKVTASRDGASADSGPISIRVPQHCGMLSIPICVETEGARKP